MEKWEVHYHSCADIIQPYRQQLLESETSFCDICHKNCTSPADFVLHQEHVHLCLPLFVCPVCHFTYITRSCLCMHITESHGGPATAISLIKFFFFEIVLVIPFHNLFDVILYYIYSHRPVILERIFKYMFDYYERMNSKSRHNRNFDHFHPSTHTYTKVTTYIHSIYKCIGTLCHSRVIFIGISITALEVLNTRVYIVNTIHWYRN